MSTPKRHFLFSAGISVLVVLATSGCTTAPQSSGIKRIKAGQEHAGFLKDYTKLAPNPAIDGDVKTFAQADAQKNLRNYIAVIVDPVDIYLASNADDAKLPEQTRAAAANYFRAALTQAVFDAFPVVDRPGPLVLRLRSALIGVNADTPAAGQHAESEHAVNISKVGVEMELVDSATGEQIAAMVDREPLGEGEIVTDGDNVRHDRSAAARAAFDEWASRVRTFLNRAHELSTEDANHAIASYTPYGPAPGKK